jgi:hypothetical protein
MRWRIVPLRKWISMALPSAVSSVQIFNRNHRRGLDVIAPSSIEKSRLPSGERVIHAMFLRASNGSVRDLLLLLASRSGFAQRVNGQRGRVMILFT